MHTRTPDPRSPIRVSVVEDADDTREHLRALLTGARGLRCLGAYDRAEALLRLPPREWPDVLLLDLQLPGLSGEELIPQLKERRDAMEILVLTWHGDPGRVFPALEAGATGYLLKNHAAATDIVEAIELVHAGGAPMSAPIARMVLRRFRETARERCPLPELSSREQEVLSLVARGLQDKEVAEALSLSVRTIHTHLHRIYQKLHVRSRTEATAKFLRGRPKPQ